MVKGSGPELNKKNNQVKAKPFKAKTKERAKRRGARCCLNKGKQGTEDTSKNRQRT